MRSPAEYLLPDREHTISVRDIPNLSRVTQIEILKIWFFENFEDPAESTPYDSSEGGYIYIWGGPYDAEAELSAEFSQYVPEDIIKETVGGLEEICIEWAKKPSADDYDDSLIESIKSISEHYHKFQSAILDIEKLLDLDIPHDMHGVYYRLMYANVITTMETYLSDMFIAIVLNRDKYFRKYVECNQEFKEKKIQLSEIFKETINIAEYVKQSILKIAWHNIEKVSRLYKNVLDVDLPEDKKDIIDAVVIRHDIVHRNGFTKTGNQIIILKTDVDDLKQLVVKLIQYIDTAISVKGILP